MAVTFSLTDGASGEGVTSVTLPFTCGASDVLLVGGAGATDSVHRDVSAFTYNGTTLIESIAVTQGNLGSELWYLTNPDTGSEYDMIVTLSSKCDEIIIIATTYIGVDTADPVGTGVGAGGDSSSATVDVTDSAVDDMVVDFQYNTTPDTVSGDQNHTFTNSVVIAGVFGVSAGAQRTAGSASTVTMQWDINDDSWGICAVNLNASGGAPANAMPMAMHHYRQRRNN